MIFSWRAIDRLRLLTATRAIALAFLLALSVRSMNGQSTNASLTGRITDSTKAVAPNAKVIAINTGTRVRYETVTNETGSYYVSNLPPGTYRIEVEKLGFKAVLKSDVILHVQDALEINFEMVLGSASESVTVPGGAPLLDTESSTIGTVVEQRKANELPLNGRNVFNLIELAASVVPQGGSTGTPERRVPGRSAVKYRLHQFTGSDSNTGLHSGIQGANQQSWAGMGEVLRRSNQPQHQNRDEHHSWRSIRISSQQNLQRQRFLSEFGRPTETSLGAEPIRSERWRPREHSAP
jgi:hypothetical protein